MMTTNSGRVYRPKDSETLVLYLKDLNLPKPDKWGTSQLIAFLQQVHELCTVIFQRFPLYKRNLNVVCLILPLCLHSSIFLLLHLPLCFSLLPTIGIFSAVFCLFLILSFNYLSSVSHL